MDDRYHHLILDDALVGKAARVFFSWRVSAAGLIKRGTDWDNSTAEQIIGDFLNLLFEYAEFPDGS